MPTTYVRTWQMNYNAVMDSTDGTHAMRNAVWQLKAMLKGEISLFDITGAAIGSPAGLWTCAGSSDAVTAAMDGTDRWTSSYNFSKLVDSNTVARSWIVLKSPNNFGGGTGFLYYTICLDQTSATQMTTVVSRTLPSGGSTTARPTAPDEMVQVFASFTGGNNLVRTYGGVTSLGEWFFITSHNSAQLCGTAFLMGLLESKSVDTFPYVYVAQGSTAQSGKAFHHSTSGTSNPSGNLMRDRQNLATLNPTLCPWGHPQNANSLVFASMTGTDTTDAAYDDMPIYVFVNRGGYFSIRGRIPDLRWGPDGLAEASWEPIAGTPQSMFVGSMWVPTYIAPTL